MTTLYNPIGWANRVKKVPLKTVPKQEALAIAV